MTTVYLIRHGEAEGNLYRRFQGWHDGLITERGMRQIRALEERFAGIHIDAVYSSDLRRAMTTAGAIYKPRGLELRTDPQLREIRGGVWEDRPWGELRREDPALMDAFNRADPAWQVEGSETYGMVQARLTGAIRDIAARHPGQTVAVVAHGAAIRTALAGFYGYPVEEIARVPHGDNTCVAKLLFDGDRVEVEYFNDNSHLGELSTLGRQSWWKKDGGADYGKLNLWFRPLDLNREEEFYRQARLEAWQTSHGTVEGFDGDAFCRVARANSAAGPNRVLAAMQGERPVGILQMDDEAAADQGAGFIWFLYLLPELRGKGFGGQLLGQAVSRYRSLGRGAIRLRCAPENTAGEAFYRRHGFYPVGRVPGGLDWLDLLEKKIVPGEA